MTVESNQVTVRRERLLKVLSAATFLIFFQAYMVGPLIPRLAVAFGVSAQHIGMIVPVYLIPYGISTLFYGVLSDHFGRRRIMLASLLVFVVLTGLTATARTAGQMMVWRFVTGIGASGVVPLALALMGNLFPYEQRGRPLGWLFGAMAGGAAFGSTVGVMVEPFIGWRMLFVGIAIATSAVFVLLLPYASLLGDPAKAAQRPSLAEVFGGYRSLLGTRRGARTYGYVFWNAIFHSGVFTWLGLYFSERYRLDEVGIGLALLGYGIPGFLLGPIIGRAADKWGRKRLVPAGIAIAALVAAALMTNPPLLVAALAVTLLSLGYDMTQPLLAGIVTALGGKRGGQAMGLNVFILFVGFGIGSYVFGEALRFGFSRALAAFAVVQLFAALFAIPLFRSEEVIQQSNDVSK